MIQKIRLKVKRKEDELRDEIMNTKYHLDLSSSPQNIRLPFSSGTIEGPIMQDQALVANVTGMCNNTSRPSSSQYKAVDANETAMSPDHIMNSLLNNFCSSPQDCGITLEVLLGADGSLPSSSQ